MSDDDTIFTDDYLAQIATDLTAAAVNGLARAAHPSHSIGDQVSGIFADTYKGLKEKLTEPEEEPRPDPAVPISKSITHEHIICLEDGAKLKMLKRYLKTRFGMTPDQYRARWGLPADYPMVAPEYTQRRSEFAKSIGLGKRKPDNQS